MEEEKKVINKRKKRNLLIVILLLIVFYMLFIASLILFPSFGYHKTYPHDNIVSLLLGIAYLMPIIFLLISLIMTMIINVDDNNSRENNLDEKSTFSKKSFDEKISFIKTIIIVFVIIIPISLKVISGYISYYDRSHYEGEPYIKKWEPIDSQKK